MNSIRFGTETYWIFGTRCQRPVRLTFESTGAYCGRFRALAEIAHSLTSHLAGFSHEVLHEGEFPLSARRHVHPRAVASGPFCLLLVGSAP
jgi:hypothetical protein